MDGDLQQAVAGQSVTLTLTEEVDIGVCHLSLSKDNGFDFEAHQANRDLGGFPLIDRIPRATVGAGLIHLALYRRPPDDPRQDWQQSFH